MGQLLSRIQQWLHNLSQLGTNRRLPSLKRWTESANEARLDEPLLFVGLSLLAFGLLMVYSASVSTAAEGSGYGTSFLVRQSAYLAVALVLSLVLFQVPMRLWQKMAPWLFVIGLVLLALVLIPGIGKSVLGARRWIGLGPLNIQPSELMKLFVILYGADYTVRKASQLKSLQKGFLPMALAMFLVGALLLYEPDFGAFVVMTCLIMALLFLGGLNVRLFVVLLVLLGVGFALLIATAPYRLKRLVGFMDPWADPLGKGYQLSHSLMAFGHGGIGGVGLGRSVEKLFYLPEAHTDFLLAVIAEELGLIGTLVLITAFAWLTWRAFAIARQALLQDQHFSAFVCFGVGTWIGVQGFFNMGVNMGLLPTKGLTLPFLSYGGSAIVLSTISIMLLLKVDWECRRLRRREPI